MRVPLITSVSVSGAWREFQLLCHPARSPRDVTQTCCKMNVASRRHFFVHALTDLSKSYFPVGPAQVAICTYGQLHVYTREFSWHRSYNILEPDRPQHDRPATSVIAQQYCSTTIVSLHFNSRNEKFGARLKNVIRSCLLFRNFTNLQCVNRGVSVYWHVCTVRQLHTLRPVLTKTRHCL